MASTHQSSALKRNLGNTQCHSSTKTPSPQPLKQANSHSSTQALDSALIGKVYAGSESNPYAVKPIAAKVAQVLKLGKEDGDVQSVDAIDTEFACKAGSSMFKDACALVSYPKSGINYAMVIGADNSQAAPRGCPGGELDQFVGYGGSSIHLRQTRRHRRSRRLVQLHLRYP